MARDKETMKTDLDISLKNLKTDYIDLYQFHNIRTMDDYEKILRENGAYSALEEAKAAVKGGNLDVKKKAAKKIKDSKEGIKKLKSKVKLLKKKNKNKKCK